MYVSPLFDLTELTNYADDNFRIEWSENVNELIEDMQRNLEIIKK